MNKIRSLLLKGHELPDIIFRKYTRAGEYRTPGERDRDGFILATVLAATLGYGIKLEYCELSSGEFQLYRGRYIIHTIPVGTVIDKDYIITVLNSIVRHHQKHYIRMSNSLSQWWKATQRIRDEAIIL